MFDLASATRKSVAAITELGLSTLSRSSLLLIDAMKLSNGDHLAERFINPFPENPFGPAKTVLFAIESKKIAERDAWGPRYESANSGVSESVNVKY